MEKMFYTLFWVGRTGKLYGFNCWATSEEDAVKQFNKRFMGLKTVYSIRVSKSEDVIVL